MGIKDDIERARLEHELRTSLLDKISKDPEVAQKGYQAVLELKDLVDQAIQSNDALTVEDLTYIAKQVQVGVLSELETTSACKDSVHDNPANRLVVAHALANCMATLDYLMTKYGTK